MAVDLELTPKTKRPAGERCCEPVTYPDVEREHAVRIAQVVKALGDPRRGEGAVRMAELTDMAYSEAGSPTPRNSTTRSTPPPRTMDPC